MCAEYCQTSNKGIGKKTNIQMINDNDEVFNKALGDQEIGGN